jgi:hypothetical protein
MKRWIKFFQTVISHFMLRCTAGRQAKAIIKKGTNEFLVSIFIIRCRMMEKKGK